MADLGIKLGIKNLREYPGAWVYRVDDEWTIAINGKDEPQRVEPEGCMATTIQPFDAAVWFNGWLAATLSPLEGIFAAGAGANEDTFIEAMDRAIAKAA